MKNIYSHLGDEESRFLFEKRLCYSLTDDKKRMIEAISKKMNQQIDCFEKLSESRKELFIFGAGNNGRSTVKAFPEIPWRAFIENNCSKAGESDILPIISFQEFIENSQNALVFISSPIYGFEMKLQLINNGFPEDSIINFFDKKYFDLPYFKPQENEFFIDIGGYYGFSTKDFFQWQQDDKSRSIIFEPNPISYNVCKCNLQNYENVKIINKGLWHKAENLNFHKAGINSSITIDGEEIIETVTLDEYLKEEKETVTFIKMDINGAELNVLKGAEHTIRGQKPKLAISIYHKPEDIWEILNLLLEFVPDYKFYIRHYFDWSYDTVLYAKVSNE